MSVFKHKRSSHDVGSPLVASMGIGTAMGIASESCTPKAGWPWPQDRKGAHGKLVRLPLRKGGAVESP